MSIPFFRPHKPRHQHQNFRPYTSVVEPDYGMDWGRTTYDDGTEPAPQPRCVTRHEAHAYYLNLSQSERSKIDTLAAWVLTARGIQGGNHGSYWWGYGTRLVTTDLMRHGVDLWELEAPVRG